jgi:hypothetical protein
MGTTYRHRQMSRTTLLVLGLAWVAALWGAVRAAQPVAITVAVLVGALLVLFSSLTVIVHEQAVVVFFGPGLIRRSIPLRRVRDVRAVQTPWYYGWGIRLTPYGWLWNVHGLGGVEIQFDDGHRFRIGSDEPDKLAAAILEARRAV